MIKCIKIQREHTGTKTFPLGLDKKGRQKDYRVDTFIDEYIENCDAFAWCDIEPGIWYIAEFTTLVNGKRYGPYTINGFAKTEQELGIIIKSRVENAMKRFNHR